MKQTTFDEFVELTRRGTFVPVVKEIIADLLTPVSAFLKIAEHSDYAFLFESVEGGEQVARYSFLGKDPFLVLKASQGKTTLDRSGVRTETDEPFIRVLRRLMTEFRSPYVPGLPRFTGGAVGFIGYDAAPVFEPALQPAWSKASWAAGEAEDDAGFMLFDTVLAFDHVKHRILIIANARIAADEDLRALYQFACAKIQFLERELERGLSQPNVHRGAAPEVRSNLTPEAFESGVRRIKERIAAGDIYQAGGGRPVHRLPRTAPRQPVTVHVFHAHGRTRGRRIVPRDARTGRRSSRRDASDRRHPAAWRARRRGPPAGRGAEAQ
jgi:anthranilate synthase component 1